jgi:hypothetical protein
MAPIDAALGTIDFLETRHVVERHPPLGFQGLYYKLLNAGLRVALVGGSDNSCVSEQIGDTRTWARIAQEPLTYTRWCEAVARRETSVSDGSALFLEMHVGDAPIGAEVALDAPGVVIVRATLHVSAGESAAGRLWLIMNGVKVAAKSYALPLGGKATLAAQVPFARSAWVAASADSGAHTGATFVSVADRPIATVKDAAYWRAYCDDMREQIGVFAVPSAEAEILARVDAARQVYAALEAVGLPLPAGVTRYGHSTPACQGPVAIGVDGPPSTSFRVTCLNAPSGAAGLLLVGSSADARGAPMLGAAVFVDLASSYSTFSVQANGGGYAEAPLALPAGVRHVVCQFVWANTAGCGGAGGGPLSASDALEIQLP